MKVKLLIASDDTRYALKLSEQIALNHSETMEVTVCQTKESIKETSQKIKFDVALLDNAFVIFSNEVRSSLTVILHSNDQIEDIPAELIQIEKYERVSSIVADVLEHYSKVAKNVSIGAKKSIITAIWSPAGGAGTTTVAIAKASILAAEGKSVFYLNLETFSSMGAYFNESRKSISTVFEMLENPDCDIKMMISGVVCEENGITYLSAPSNFDDINILSVENIQLLVESCSALFEELIIDISLPCDNRTQKVFELAEEVFLVTNKTQTSKSKLNQFVCQSNIFESIRLKTTIIANQNAKINDSHSCKVTTLPVAKATIEKAVVKELSQHLRSDK